MTKNHERILNKVILSYISCDLNQVTISTIENHLVPVDRNECGRADRSLLATIYSLFHHKQALLVHISVIIKYSERDLSALLSGSSPRVQRLAA